MLLLPSLRNHRVVGSIWVDYSHWTCFVLAAAFMPAFVLTYMHCPQAGRRWEFDKCVRNKRLLENG